MSEQLDTVVATYHEKCQKMVELQDSIFVTKKQIGELALEVEQTVRKYKAEKMRLLEEIRDLDTRYEKLLPELQQMKAAIMGSHGNGEDDTFCGMCVMPSTTAKTKRN